MVTYNTSTDNFGVTSLIVDGTVTGGVYQGLGNYQTITLALAAAVSGQTIFIRTGTYTENLTLVAGVNLTAFGSDSSSNGTGKVIISGTCTLTTAGTVTISGIQLQTNSAALLAVTGSAASIVNLNNCYLNMTTTTGITFSAANTSSAITISYCGGNLGTTGIGIYTNTSTGTLVIEKCKITNTGASTTASTTSAGGVNLVFNSFNSVFSTSSGGAMSMFESVIDVSAINTAILTTVGTGIQTISHCYMNSGSAATISIGTGTTVNLFNSVIASTNGTAAITGAGTLIYSGNSLPSTGKIINVTTQTGGLLAGGLFQAPSAGYIGESMSNTGTTVSLSSPTAKTIASINLTPGVWDVSCVGIATLSGLNGTAFKIGISTTDNTLTGTAGIDFITCNSAALLYSIFGSSIASARKTITVSTIYYLVMEADFGTGTATGTGRISGTRVG